MKRRHPGMLSQATPPPAIAPVGEQGWLTPIRATAGSASDWIFECRCGERVVRRAKDVRKSVALGATPKCKRLCTGVRAAVVAQEKAS